MTNDEQAKEEKTAVGEDETQLSSLEESSASSSPTQGAENPRNDTNPPVRFPNVDQRVLSGSLYSDPATSKLASISLMNMMPLMALPPQAAPLPLFPRPVRRRSRISREEFRRRLIETIDEALRIAEDDSDIEGTESRDN